MAKAAGVSPATVQRVWSARGLKPHLVRTSKLSNDRRFDEKLISLAAPGRDPAQRRARKIEPQLGAVAARHGMGI